MQKREIPYLVLSGIFSLCLFILVIATLVYTTMCQKWYLEVTVSHSHYCEKLASELNKDMSNYALGSNIPETLLKSVITEEQVEQDTLDYLKQVGVETQSKISTEDLKQSIIQKIENYSVESELSIHSDEAVSNLAENLVSVYEKAIQQPFFALFFKQVLVYRPYLVKIIFGAAIAGILIFLFLFRALRKNTHLFFKLFAFSFMAASLMILIPSAYLLITNYFSRLPIYNQAIYQLTFTYLKNSLYIFLFSGVELFLLGLFFGALAEGRRNEKRRRATARERKSRH